MIAVFCLPAPDGEMFAADAFASAVGKTMTFKAPFLPEAPSVAAVLASAFVLPGGSSAELTADLPEDCEITRTITAWAGGTVDGPVKIHEDGVSFRPLTREDARQDSQRLLWACKCGKGAQPDLRISAGPEAVRAEAERQALAHLRENAHDLLHVTYLGTFTESLCLDAGPDREVLHRKAGDVPDTYGPHPYLS
jgi:hypothetical protein